MRVPFIMGKDAEGSAINTSCFVQVLGVGTDTGCTVPSVLLFFDRHRYLFNAGEGFQRFCVEHKVRLTKVTSVLATRVTTEATGGLPGMLLTMADTTAGGLLTAHGGMTVHGPPGLHTLVNAFRTFVNVKDLGLKVMEFSGGEDAPRPVVKNEAVSITPVVITPAAAAAAGEPSAKRQRTDGDDAAAAAPTAPAGDGLSVPSVTRESGVACYICELPDIPGKFLPQKAASLGVPRGPLYGQLVKGMEVKAANGRMVHPSEVMEPATPGPVVIVVDCPSEAFVAGLADPAAGVGRWAADDAVRSKGEFSVGVSVCPSQHSTDSSQSPAVTDRRGASPFRGALATETPGQHSHGRQSLGPPPQWHAEVHAARTFTIPTFLRFLYPRGTSSSFWSPLYH